MSLRFDVKTDRIDLADELEEEYRVGVKAAVTDAANLLLAESHRLITAYGDAGPAPAGSTPATDTGNLRKMTKRLPYRGRSRSRYASSGVAYAPHAHLLEYGHNNSDGTRTLPRPFIDLAMTNAESDIENLLRERLG
jgi:hypothetical protein